MMARRNCLKSIELPELPRKYDESFDPSGWCQYVRLKPQVSEKPRRPCRSTPPGCREDATRGRRYLRRDIFELPPIPVENCIDKHSRFIETTIGCIDFHDFDKRKYFRNFQGRHDLDIIRRSVPLNLCEGYPGATMRYFALNWPEYCIFVSTA
uniref:Peptidase S1 domain-containing protein n=1 Tax=Mesocestoides corti TaxID=53468 RepID=A0A5K3EQJ9_MESCO